MKSKRLVLKISTDAASQLRSTVVSQGEQRKKELDAFLHDSVFLLPTALSLSKLIVCSVVLLNLDFPSADGRSSGHVPSLASSVLQ